MEPFFVGPHRIVPEAQVHSGRTIRDARIFPFDRPLGVSPNPTTLHIDHGGEVLSVRSPASPWGDGWWLLVVPPEEWPYGVWPGIRRVFTMAVQKWGVGLTLAELLARSESDLAALDNVGQSTLIHWRQWLAYRQTPRHATCPTCGTHFKSEAVTP